MSTLPDRDAFLDTMAARVCEQGHVIRVTSASKNGLRFLDLRGRGNVLICPMYDETLKLMRWVGGVKASYSLSELAARVHPSLQEGLHCLHAYSREKVMLHLGQEYTCVGFGDLDVEDANRLARYHEWLLTELNCTFDEDASDADVWYEHFRLPSGFRFRMARYKRNPLFLDVPAFSCNYPGDLEAYLGDVRRARDEFVTVTRHLGTPVLYASTGEGGQ